MGWLWVHREPGQSNRAFFESELPQTLTVTGEIVADTTVGGVYYAAVRNRADGVTWAFVALTARQPSSWANFGYKDMAETSGPVASCASKPVLDALTETDSEWANEWRQRCRDRLDARDARPKVRSGDLVRFAVPLGFTDGSRHQQLRFVSHSTFLDPADPTGRSQYRVSRWRDREYVVVDESAPHAASPA